MTYNQIKIFLFSVCLILLSGLNTNSSSKDLQWTLRHPQVTANNLNTVIWGGDKYVVVGDVGTILTSSHGDEWTLQSSGTEKNLLSVAWSGEKFVASGKAKTILTSTDGVNWTVQISQGIYRELIAIAWTGNSFVGIYSDSIYTSTDGIQWTSQFTGCTKRFKNIMWAENKCIISADSGTILVSSDMQTWDTHFLVDSINSNDHICDVIWTGKQFLAIDIGIDIYLSTDGKTWKEPSSNMGCHNGHKWLIAGGENKIVVVGGYGNLLFSNNFTADYIGLEESLSPTPWHFNDIIWVNSTFIAVGDCGTIVTSSDGETWENKLASSPFNLNSLTMGNQLIAVGDSGSIMSSPDGITWKCQKSDTRKPLTGIAWSGDCYVTVGLEGIIIRSPDGITWSEETSNTRMDLHDIAWGNGKFVATGAFKNDTAIFMVSQNGKTWLPYSYHDLFISDIKTQSITWTGNNFVAVGERGIFFLSNDGINWVANDSISYNSLYSVSWNDNRGIAVGESNTIISSSNGTKWTEHSSVNGFDRDDLWSAIFVDTHYITFPLVDDSDPDDKGIAFISKYASDWHGHFTGYKRNLHCVTTTPTHIVAAGEGGTILTSPLGTSPILEEPDHSKTAPVLILHIQKGILYATIPENMQNKKVQISIYSLKGKHIMLPYTTKTQKRLSFDVSTVASGVYLLSIQFEKTVLDQVFSFVR